MHILCPHCRNPIELVKLTPREEIACPSCGSSFRLETGETTAGNPARKKLGRFEVGDLLGSGGFGSVYRAHDPELGRAVLQNVERLREQGKCIIYSTHHMREVEKLCRRVAIINQGKILAHGVLDELRREHWEQDLDELFFQLVG